MAMDKTVIGLFDNFTEAQAVVQDLVNSGFPREDIGMVANDATGEYKNYVSAPSDQTSGTATGAGAGAVIGGIGGLLVGLGALAIPGIGPIIAAGPIATTLAGAGVGALAGGLIGALTDLGVPEEEAHYYAEGVRRGGVLVTVRTDDAKADRAADIMRRHDAVDIDSRSENWRQSGWNRFDATAKPYTAEDITRERDRYRTQTTTATVAQGAGRTQAATPARESGRARTSDRGETTIPVVEEEVQIGKRAVQRGGVRAYTRVVEKPVEETVQLRDERVTVERRPVDRPASAADFDAMKGRTVEVTETDEEAVVAKRARVVEEVTIGKQAEQRTETVRDKVRRTDVEVEQLGATQGTGVSGFEAYDTDFRTHFRTAFSTRGHTYERYAPAYRYGYDLAADQRYSGRDWTVIESQARRDWEGRNQGAWEDFKDAIRYAWDKARGTARRATS